MSLDVVHQVLLGQGTSLPRSAQGRNAIPTSVRQLYARRVFAILFRSWIPIAAALHLWNILQINDGFGSDRLRPPIFLDVSPIVRKLLAIFLNLIIHFIILTLVKLILIYLIRATPFLLALVKAHLLLGFIVLYTVLFQLPHGV